MESPVPILLAGFIYVILFGGLSWLRREGLSVRFAVEAVLITLSVAGLGALSSVLIHPVLFLALLYLLTMRVRLLVDVGNLFAQRGQMTRADRLYTLATRLWPDASGRLIVQINEGVSLLQRGELDEAIGLLKEVLQKSTHGYLGVKQEAAAHYNLGVAYRRKQLEAQAIVEFNTVLETWPASEYARRAEAALQQVRHKN
jgi:tetratricopeptide (TPR) repeat protein